VACVRRWLWFVVLAHAAFLALLLKTGAQPPTLEVWIYCLGILLIVFGIRALTGSWDDWLPLRIAAIALLVFYGSFSDVIPFVTPVTTLLVGLALIGAAYCRWRNVEMD
jgi:ABC-type transport system involved in cytochrome bd biosynthesis fused ATPase/permease subunit